MAVLPLSHHDIVELVRPFAERKRHIDLAVSNRLERRLIFKPPAVEGPGQADEAAPHETLQLEGLASGNWRLTRLLRERGGLQAMLQAVGSKPGELLARVEAVDTARHFRHGAGYRIARDYAIDDTGLVLTRAVLQLDEGLRLQIVVPEMRRMSGSIELTATQGEGLAELPEDLLAVLGWSWSRLERGRLNMSGKLRLRGSAESRTAQAEAALDRVAGHLAQTLAEPPARFHDRLKLARYGVKFFSVDGVIP